MPSAFRDARVRQYHSLLNVHNNLLTDHANAKVRIERLESTLRMVTTVLKKSRRHLPQFSSERAYLDSVLMEIEEQLKPASP